MTWVLKNKNLFGQFAWAVNIPLIIALIFTPTLVGKWKGMYKLNLRGYILAVIGRALVVVADIWVASADDGIYGSCSIRTGTMQGEIMRLSHPALNTLILHRERELTELCTLVRSWCKDRGGMERLLLDGCLISVVTLEQMQLSHSPHLI